MRVSHQKKNNNESSFEYLYINNLEYTEINWQVQILCPTKYDLMYELLIKKWQAAAFFPFLIMKV